MIISEKFLQWEYKEYVILLSQAESIWEEAREKADFELI